jgi:hypothetical protein
MTTYKIKLNRQMDEDGRIAIFSRFPPGYAIGDALDIVGEGEIEIPAADALDYLWEIFNRGAPGFVGDDVWPHRSLSVGDVIEIDDRVYAIEPLGFKLIGGSAPMVEHPTGPNIYDDNPKSEGYHDRMADIYDMRERK